MKKQEESAMERAAREAKNAYVRTWRAKNRDKVKAYQYSYWMRKVSQGAGNGQETTAEGR